MTPLELMEKMQRGEVAPPPIGQLLGFQVASVSPGQAVHWSLVRYNDAAHLDLVE